jgi:hypothetical protein
MKFMMRKALSCFCLLLLTATVAFAQKGKHSVPQPPSADVISRVTAAKKVFLSNAGANPVYATDEMIGGANGGYNALYASLKQWGHFQLVDAPTQADLIFEIRSLESCDIEKPGNGIHERDYTQTCTQPTFNLSILDPSTRTPLYVIVSPAGKASSLKKGQIAFAKSIDTLTDKIKVLVAAPAPAQNP